MERINQPGIYFAPLQESTDFVYRKAHALNFGGIDKYFSPYLLVQKDGTLKKSHLRDTAPENCTGYQLVPQIMAGNSNDFLFLAKHLTDLGYQEINWNLGCPYPMVTGKGMGSGLLPYPEKISEILDQSLPRLTCRISVKLRSGLNSPEEIFQVIPVLNQYPLAEVILHPRIAKQLYSGTADHELFEKVATLITHPLVYNGDIGTLEDFQEAGKRFESVTNWMIGRGMLKNPFLALEIKGVQLPGRIEKIEMFERFHGEILGSYASMLSGQGHLITRMTKFWEYFSFQFPDPHKAFKRVKKSVNMSKYEIAIRENFSQLRDEE
ncbi:MAG: tRNA-dihydrouridine synthase family protein [Bacteroidia bacterium]|nr:tRNA-dihydrouridine synthase family protein [Bacteroidia bacterium]